MTLGSDGNPASVSYSAGNPVSLTLTGTSATYGSLDSGNVGTPSSITGGTIGVNIGSTDASILIGQSSTGGQGLNANVTGQGGQGILASATGLGAIAVTMAPGTTVSGSSTAMQLSTATGTLSVTENGAITSSGGNGLSVSSTAGAITVNTAAGSSITGSQNAVLAATGTGPLSITVNGTLQTSQPTTYWDILATSTGGNITVGGTGTASSGGVSLSNSGTTGSITVQGGVSVADLSGPGILASLTNAGNGSMITIGTSGNISGSTDAISAATAGTGNILVNTSGTIQGGSGYGVRLVATTGTNTVNVGAGSTVGGGAGAMSLTGTSTVNNSGTINGLIASMGGPLTFNNAGTFNISSGGATNVQQVTTFNGQGGTVVFSVNRTTSTADVLRVTNLSGATKATINVLGGAAPIANPTTIITANNIAAGTTVTANNSGLFNYGIKTVADPTIPGATDYQVFSTLNAAVAAATPSGIDAIITALSTGFFQNASAFVSEPADPVANQVNGGPWIRGSTGRNDISATASAGGASVASKVRTDFAGFQTGVDLGVANIQGSGWNSHVGVTAGQVFLGINDLMTAGINNRTNVPFVGVYGALTGHGFFADVQVRQDFYNMSLSNVAAGLSGTPLQGRAFAFNTSAGYKFELPMNWFVEPSAAFLYSRLVVDSLPLGALGSLTFNPFLSEIARAGVRVGTTFVLERVALQPFGTLSIWREFAGPTSSNYVAPGSAPVPLSVTRVGTFGQVGAGVSGALLKTGLLGFLRADYRFGDAISGYAVVAGLRYEF